MRTAILALILVLTMGCASSTVYMKKHGEHSHVIDCWIFGQATCVLQDPEDESIIVVVEGDGLSDNGVVVIFKTITELPKVIIKALFPIGKVLDMMGGAEGE